MTDPRARQRGMCTLRGIQDDPLELQEETIIISASINLLLLKFLFYV